MGQEYSLYQEQSQKLIMTPELRQAIAILQLPALELSDYLEQQILDNPLLEVELKTGGEDEGIQGDHIPQSDQGIDWERYLEDQDENGQGFDPSFPAPLEARRSDPFVTPSGPSLQDYLLDQLHVTDCQAQIYRWAEYIIGNLDERGYLSFSFDELVQEQGCSTEEMGEALTLVQGFEPAGIAARNLKECLYLQLVRKSMVSPKLTELLNHLEDLAAGRLPKIAHALQLSLSEVQTMTDLIRSLNPKPGARFASTGDTRFIVADIIVEEVIGQFTILINDTSVPRLRVNEAYRKALMQEEQGEVRKFAEQKLNAAAWLIKSVEQRRLTLYKVAEAVVHRQESFFRHGPSGLKPLTMKEIGEEIGVHESTVSRAVANKYIQSPGGVFPFKYLFANRLGEEQVISTAGIKHTLRSIIARENPLHPYSDQKLVEQLREKGIEISRRTIAKYRDELGVASAAVRKSYGRNKDNNE